MQINKMAMSAKKNFFFFYSLLIGVITSQREKSPKKQSVGVYF